MSSTEIVHGKQTTPPPGFSKGGHGEHLTSYALHAQPPVPAPAPSPASSPAVGVTNHSVAGAGDKRFTTAYGNVVWPTLPGLSSSPESAPMAGSGAATRPGSASLVHHHPSSAVAAAPKTAQTLMPATTGMIAEHPSVPRCGAPLVGLHAYASGACYSFMSTNIARSTCSSSYSTCFSVSRVMIIFCVIMLPPGGVCSTPKRIWQVAYNVVVDTDGDADALETVAQQNVPHRLNIGFRVGQNHPSLFGHLVSVYCRGCLLSSGRPKFIVLQLVDLSHSTLHAVRSAIHPYDTHAAASSEDVVQFQRGRFVAAYH